MKKKLVLLHGLAANSLIWEPLISELETRFEVFPIDLPGYGKEVQFDGVYDLGSLTADVLERAPKKAAWVGWSLGGTIALNAAIAAPERFEKLQLISATPCFLNQTGGNPWSGGVEAEPFEKIETLFQLAYGKALNRFLLMQSNRSTSAAISHSKTLVRETSKRLMTASTPSHETLQGGLNILRNTDLRNQLAQLKIPLQVIAGVHDQIVPPDASRHIAESVLPNSEFHLLETGHIPFLESASEYLRLLTKFACETPTTNQ